MYIEKSSGITVSNLRFKNAPNVFHSVTGSSTNVIYTGLQLSAVEDDGAVPKNTDGFDVGSSTFVTIHNTTVVNDDDCVAFKSGSSFTTVTDITCTGSHGTLSLSHRLPHVNTLSCVLKVYPWAR